MLVRAVAISRQRLQTEAIGRLESDGNSCSHAPDSHAFRPTGNPLRDSNVRRDPLESSLCLTMILSENRFPLFRIMLSSHRFDSMTPQKPPPARAQITPAGLMFLAITSIGWGFNWPVTKYLLSELPPLTMRGSSGVVGAALLAGVAGLRGPNPRVPPGKGVWVGVGPPLLPGRLVA